MLKKISGILHLVKDVNWAEEFKNWYGRIDSVSKKSFWVIFAVTNLVWLYHGVHFLWGNHDWSFIVNGSWKTVSWWDGRLCVYFFYQLLGGRYLPLILNVVAMGYFSLAIVLLLNYWRVPKSMMSFVMLGLLVALTPFAIVWFYFINGHISIFAVILLIVAALMLSEKNKIMPSIGAVALLLAAFLSYPASLNAIAVIFSGRIFLAYCLENQSIKTCCKKFWCTALNCVLSMLVFKVILSCLKATGNTRNFYNNQTISFAQVPAKLITIVQASWQQFWQPYPFIELTYLSAVFAIIVIFLLLIILNKTTSLKTHMRVASVGVLLFSGVVLASKSAAFLSSDVTVVITPRIDFYGLPYLYLLAAVFIVRSSVVWSKNVLLIALVFIIPMSALRAIEAQKVWKLGFDAEKETAIDITHRFEANDAFDIQKKYKLLAIGAPEGMRKYYHHTPYSDDNLLNRSYTAWWQWGQRQVFSFYEPRLKWKDVICVITGYPASSPYEKVKKTILELNKDLLRQAKPYPHSKSVYVDGEYIVVVYDQVNLDYIRSILKDGK